MSDIVKELDKWIASGTSPVKELFIELATDAKAELARLTDALAAAERERDAAKRKIRQALAELQSEVDRQTDYDSAYIDEAHAILYNALTAEERAAPPVYEWHEPQPDTADAAGAETVADVRAYALAGDPKPTLKVMRSRLEAIKISFSKSSPEMRELGLREMMYLLEDLVDIYADSDLSKGGKQS